MRTLLAVTWIALAVWFAWGSDDSRLGVLGTIPASPAVASDALMPGVRATLTDPPRVRIGGVDQKCSDCHALFASLDVTPGDIRQHGHIALDHGLNDRCFNCHSQRQRNLLVLHDGSEVGFSASTQLCAKCHGTVYRDWERGMHGRTLHSWDTEQGRERTRCVACHDPHSPAFGQIAPLPGPNTWRMTPQHDVEDHAAERNPLERWKTLPGTAGNRRGRQP